MFQYTKNKMGRKKKKKKENKIEKYSSPQCVMHHVISASDLKTNQLIEMG